MWRRTPFLWETTCQLSSILPFRPRCYGRKRMPVTIIESASPLLPASLTLDTLIRSEMLQTFLLSRWREHCSSRWLQSTCSGDHLPLPRSLTSKLVWEYFGGNCICLHYTLIGWVCFRKVPLRFIFISKFYLRLSSYIYFMHVW